MEKPQENQKPQDPEFVIKGSQIGIISAALGELPAKISYQSLRILDTLQEVKK